MGGSVPPLVLLICSKPRRGAAFMAGVILVITAVLALLAASGLRRPRRPAPAEALDDLMRGLTVDGGRDDTVLLEMRRTG
jgi:hypothetical protein